jgi:hypothetical protein
LSSYLSKRVDRAERHLIVGRYDPTNIRMLGQNSAHDRQRGIAPPATLFGLDDDLNILVAIQHLMNTSRSQPRHRAPKLALQMNDFPSAT